MDSYSILILSWAIYFFCHSYLAANRAKSRIQNLLGLGNRSYRLAYNLISILGLLAVLFINGSIQSNFIFPPNEWSRWGSLILAAWGLIVIRLSFRRYSIRQFMGIEEESSGRESQLQTVGILSKVRHPIYSGTILLVTGFWLFNPKMSTLVSVGCIFAYLGIGIRLEEGKLIREFGQRYLDYKKKVPMLIPRLFK